MNSSQPEFSKIASLFQIPESLHATPEPSAPRKKHGDTPEESRELGSMSLTDGDFEQAIKHFKRAIEQRGDATAEDVLDLAAAYEYGDLIPQAYRQYMQALVSRQESPEIWLGLSDVMKRSARVKEAIESLQELIRRFPGNAYHWLKLAETLRENGYPKKAVSAAQEAVLAKPDDSFYHYWLGDLLLELGQTQEALDSIRAAIELSPGDDLLYVKAAVGFWRLDRKQEAIKAVRLASDLDPDKPLYHGLLEALLEEADLNEEANLESAAADKMDSYDHEELRRILESMSISV